MNELLLKYGCNPNQKPSKIYMQDGSELPIKVLSGKPGYINFLDAFNGWQLVRDLKNATGIPAATSFKHVSPAGAAVGLPLTETLAKIYWVDDMDWKNFSPIACPSFTKHTEFDWVYFRVIREIFISLFASSVSSLFSVTIFAISSSLIASS